jgi:replication factor A1
MTAIALTKGVLRDIFSTSKHDQVKGPVVLQVTNIKPVAIQNQVKKYRILINDGVYFAHGLIDEKCLPYLENNSFNRYSIIQANEYSVFSTQKHIFMIKSLEILSNGGEKSQSKDFINIDTYFAEHPEDDYLQVKTSEAQKQKSPSMSPQPQQQPQQQFSPPHNKPQPGQSGVSKLPGRISPIESLSPYQNNWTIKARVSYKGDIRNWSNSKGEGKLFSVNLLDESDEIKATAFNETAEKAFKIFEEGKVYFISRARVQASNKKFNHLSHPYELAFEKDTEIVECFDTANVPKLHFNFVKLNQIQNLEPNANVDVIGALKHVNESFQIIAKSTGKPFDRRNITIVDDTGFAIDVGLWNQTAINFNTPEGSIIAFKNCKVQDFNGRSLSLSHAGTMLANPETPESYQLKGWYDNQGVNESFKSLKVDSSSSSSSNIFANRKLIAEAQEENLGKAEKPEFFNIKATITFVKSDNFCYPACNNTIDNNSSQARQQASTCNRKVIEQSDGTWRCERCDINYQEPTWRYIFNCSVMDSSGQIWITLFDSEAKKLFNMDAGELLKLKQASEEDPNDKKFTQAIENINYKEFGFRVKARQDTYNDTLRVRYQAVGLDILDYNAECEHLCKELDEALN